MNKSVTLKVKCKCGETSTGLLPDANNRIAVPNFVCMKCKSSCETYIPGSQSESKTTGKGKSRKK